MTTPRVAILGGGISGLAVAYFLRKISKENNRLIEVRLFEGSPRAGGAIKTEIAEGFLLEKGPDAFITDKPWALALAKELGLENELISTQAVNRRSFIARNGKLLPVPEGFYLVAPLSVRAFLNSSIISWPGKLRMIAEPFLPKKSDDRDESIASFVRRRFGSEALERVAQAMIGGIYTGDPEVLSLRASLPRFFELEQKYGSLIRGLQIEVKSKKNPFAQASGPRYSLFASFRQGMSVFSDALVKSVPGNLIRTGFLAHGIDYEPRTRKWQVDFGEKGLKEFDAVCITLSAGRAALLLQKSLPDISKKLANISYESVATVNLAYKREQISHSLDGFGFVVPKSENKTVIACSFSSQKFAGRAPEDYVLLRAFVGGAFGRESFKRNDEELLSAVTSELKEYLGIHGNPVLTRLERYPDAMVQYRLGHTELVRDIRKDISLFPGLSLTGSSYDGVGIPDCVRAAEIEAQKIMEGV